MGPSQLWALGCSPGPGLALYLTNLDQSSQLWVKDSWIFSLTLKLR